MTNRENRDCGHVFHRNILKDYNIYLNEMQDGTDNNVMIKRNIYLYFYRKGVGRKGKSIIIQIIGLLNFP